MTADTGLAHAGISVEHNRQRQRFEARMDDQVVGVADYRPRDGVLAFTHTEVQPRVRGRGVGAALVGGALDLVRAEGGRVLPLCSFVVDYVAQHPEYHDLVEYGHSDAGGA